MARLPLPGFPNAERIQNPRAFDLRGHPTAPGPVDPITDQPRHGRQDALDGSPGIPRTVPSSKRGPGKPGTTPGGPNQGNPGYNGPHDL